MVSSLAAIIKVSACCRFSHLFGSTAKLEGEASSPVIASGEVLTLPWDPHLPLSAWGRGRASVLKFEISRGPGRPAEWMGFVPTSGNVGVMVHVAAANRSEERARPMDVLSSHGYMLLIRKDRALL